MTVQVYVVLRSAWRRLGASPLLTPGVVMASALVVLLCYRVDQQPILGDRAYLVYMGQVVFRGEPLYATTGFGYPPLGPLAAAATMHVGHWFGLPTYLAPRYLSVALVAASAGLLAHIIRHALGAAWAGALAGMLLAGFGYLGVLSTSNLEPKILLLWWSLVSALALQRRAWLIAGAAAGLGSMCWQPGVLLAIAGAIIVIGTWRREGPQAVAEYGAGIGLGLLPAAIYLSVTGGWGDFLALGLMQKASWHLPMVALQPLRWILVLGRVFAAEIVVIALAGLGFLWFCLTTVLPGARRGIREWVDPRQGSLPPLTLLWSAFNAIDLQGGPDLVPFLPCVAYWAVWLLQRLFAGVPVGGVRRLLAAGGAAALVVYACGDAVLYQPEYTLAEERALVNSIYTAAGGEPVYAFGATEVYVLREQVAPLRYLQLGDYFVTLAERLEPAGCQTLIERLQSAAPRVVVMRAETSTCADAIVRQVLRSYDVQHVVIRHRHGGWLPPASRQGSVRWLVYRRLDVSGAE